MLQSNRRLTGKTTQTLTGKTTEPFCGPNSAVTQDQTTKYCLSTHREEHTACVRNSHLHPGFQFLRRLVFKKVKNVT